MQNHIYDFIIFNPPISNSSAANMVRGYNILDNILHTVAPAFPITEAAESHRAKRQAIIKDHGRTQGQERFTITVRNIHHSDATIHRSTSTLRSISSSKTFSCTSSFRCLSPSSAPSSSTLSSRVLHSKRQYHLLIAHAHPVTSRHPMVLEMMLEHLLRCRPISTFRQLFNRIRDNSFLQKSSQT